MQDTANVTKLRHSIPRLSGPQMSGLSVQGTMFNLLHVSQISVNSCCILVKLMNFKNVHFSQLEK